MIRKSWRSRIGSLACLVAAAVALSGCVIVPARPFHHHGYYYR